MFKTYLRFFNQTFLYANSQNQLTENNLNESFIHGDIIFNYLKKIAKKLNKLN